MKEQLKNLNIFKSFNNDELDLLKKYFSYKSYKKDEIIASRNNISKELYIVLNGKIVSTLNLPGNINRKRDEYETGDFFGEISLFGYKLPFDTFYAAEESDLLIISGKKILELIENSSGIAIKFISQLLSMTIHQLRNSNKFLADVVQWGENASRRVITDELTGLYNRAFLDDALENFFYISKSNNKPLSFLMFDLDNFRDINENYGHETGNNILSELVNLIKNIISRHGIIGRYGGDEYSILLPETDLKNAVIIAEQIRADVEQHDFSRHFNGEKTTLTISIGISSFPDTATELAAFKEKADASLYQAKKTGRNKVAYIE
ncbi:MAG: GGDEF domain-containing protein [Spirochaetes bacterium]|nr:GGDEF domain-containing protein [Spirochaetota bacterium]